MLTEVDEFSNQTIGEDQQDSKTAVREAMRKPTSELSTPGNQYSQPCDMQ